ncbi:hypothetical protein E143388_02998 [Rhodococcus opacus]|nr:hypothetical protein E143388_02998 [Rhodococcus opacus]
MAERIGWDHTLRILSIHVAELCPIFLPPNPSSCATSLAGDRQCDFRFPPITRPINQGQIRTTTKLPVLTMNCGCPHWVVCGAGARGAVDLLADWWPLIKALGDVPRALNSQRRCGREHPPHTLVADHRRACANIKLSPRSSGHGPRLRRQHTVHEALRQRSERRRHPNLAADTRPLGGGGEGCVFHVKRNESTVTGSDIRIEKRRGSRR